MASDRTQCTATSKQSGERCQQSAIAGGAVCRFHGGGAKHVRASAAARLQVIAASNLADAFSLDVSSSSTPADIAPMVFALIRQRWARLQVYSALVASALGISAAAVMPTISGIEVKGLVGHTYGATQGTAVVTGEAVRALVQLEQDEAKFVSRLLFDAHKAGIAEARLQLVAQHGQVLASVLQKVFDAIEPTAAQWSTIAEVVPVLILEAVGADEGVVS